MSWVQDPGNHPDYTNNCQNLINSLIATEADLMKNQPHSLNTRLLVALQEQLTDRLSLTLDAGPALGA